MWRLLIVCNKNNRTVRFRNVSLVGRNRRRLGWQRRRRPRQAEAGGAAFCSAQWRETHDQDPNRRQCSGRCQAALQPVITDRVTVALIRKAADDLQRLQDRTNLSKTDLVNRAITLYEFIEAQLRGGHDLLVRDNRTGATQTVLIL